MLTVAPDRLRRRAGSRRSRRRRSRSGRGSRSPGSIRSRLMCVRMVDSSTRSAVAISRFQSPRATSSRTCRSGGVSASRPADRRGRVGCWAMRSITRRVTEGESRESPAVIVWMPATSSSGRVRLTRKPEAQTRRRRRPARGCPDQHPHVGRGALQLARRRDPVDVRHADVHQHDPARAAGLARRPPIG
jgi:hypothetical protein